MKQYKKIIAAVAAAAILALPLSGCSFNDVMLYLYGGDSFTKEEGEDYQTYDGENGISVTYDANIWNEPSMSQEDTIGITTGNKLSYTAVLLQVSDVYTDFLEESAAELNEEAQTVRYDFDLTIPDAETESVRYDCGTYQMILAEVNYDCGVTLHVSAASRSASYDQIVALAKRVPHRSHAGNGRIKSSSLLRAAAGGKGWLVKGKYAVFRGEISGKAPINGVRHKFCNTQQDEAVAG